MRGKAMVRIPTKKEANKLKKQRLTINTEKWKIIKRILGEEVVRTKKKFKSLSLKPPTPILQKHQWDIYKNKDFNRPIPPLRELGEYLCNKVHDEFKKSGLVEDSFVHNAETPEDNELRQKISEITKANMKKKESEENRINKARTVKKEQCAIKAQYIINTYLKMINDRHQKEILKNLSENKMAERVKNNVEKYLSEARTTNNKLVLRRHISRNSQIKLSGISLRTIIRILRNRDKTKIPFYPWFPKTPRQM